jgi:predicted anti-sigma-YlaC factor YlaD
MERPIAHRWVGRLVVVLALAANSGCATAKRIAINKLADSLAETGTTYTADNDPELVGAALPFSLKLVEGLLTQTPEHRGLLTMAASGFTEYAYAYVQQDADAAELDNVERAGELRARARRLYLRARDYGLRGLETRHRGFTKAIVGQKKAVIGECQRTDVPLLYWTAAAWAAAIAISKDHPELIADQPMVEALIDRAFVIEPDFASGALHGFLIQYEMARQGAPGDPIARARSHFDREVALTGGGLAAPFVALAEAVSVATGNRGEFEALLHSALAVDPDARPEWRLQNLIAHKRARWLLSRRDELFVR